MGVAILNLLSVVLSPNALEVSAFSVEETLGEKKEKFLQEGLNRHVLLDMLKKI